MHEMSIWINKNNQTNHCQHKTTDGIAKLTQQIKLYYANRFN